MAAAPVANASLCAAPAGNTSPCDGCHGRCPWITCCGLGCHMNTCNSSWNGYRSEHHLNSILYVIQAISPVQSVMVVALNSTCNHLTITLAIRRNDAMLMVVLCSFSYTFHRTGAVQGLALTAEAVAISPAGVAVLDIGLQSI
jgi:hypothetical protein